MLYPPMCNCYPFKYNFIEMTLKTVARHDNIIINGTHDIKFTLTVIVKRLCPLVIIIYCRDTLVIL